MLRVRLLRRFLRRFFVGLLWGRPIAGNRSLEMLIGHLQVVPGRDGLAIPDPGADNVQRELLGQLRFPRRPQVVEQLGPGLPAGPRNDPLKLGPQVHVSIAASGNIQRVNVRRIGYTSIF